MEWARMGRWGGAALVASHLGTESARLLGAGQPAGAATKDEQVEVLLYVAAGREAPPPPGVGDPRPDARECKQPRAHRYSPAEGTTSYAFREHRYWPAIPGLTVRQRF